MENSTVRKEVQKLFWNELHQFQIERADKIIEHMVEAFGDDAVTAVQEIKVDWPEPLKLYIKYTSMIIEKLMGQYGDKVIEILKEYTESDSLQRGKEISENRGDTLDNLLEVFGKGYLVSKSQSEAVIKRPGCMVSKVARELGVEDIMYYLHCYGDPFYVKGITPSISCKHIKTYMQGDDCCEYLLTVDDQ